MRALAFLTLLIAALAVGFAGTPAFADPSPPAHAKKTIRHHATRLHPAQGTQIACTVLGCHPVPPGCHPETGYDFWGNPTGLDVIACR